jgi:hypothetical protein
MPVADDHFALAHHNLHVLNHLSINKQYSDWVTSVAAYTALHLLEIVLFIDSHDNVRVKHSNDHGAREEIFKFAYPTIWKKYRPLLAASKVARYLKDEETQGQTFRGYYSSDVVCNKIFKKYLAGVINQVKTILKDRYDLTDIEAVFEKCKSSLEKNYS